MARVFDPPSRAFLAAQAREARDQAPGLALDLGCGPGHTTRLLHEVVRARLTVGLDASAPFLRAASWGAARHRLRPARRDPTALPDRIRSEGGAFRRYIALVEGVLARRGQCLTAGSRLEALSQGLSVASSRVREHGVDTRSAATMFSLDLTQLRDHADLREHVPEPEFRALAGELAALRAGGGPPITWGLRQLVLEG